MKWYIKVLKNYATFSGRARRSEYWYFTLVHIIIAIIAAIIDNILGTTFSFGSQSLPYGYIYLLYTLAIFIPALAVAVRRLHDIGKSGLWILLALFPLIGGIWLLILMVKDSVPGENQYGPNPKMIEGNDLLDFPSPSR